MRALILLAALFFMAASLALITTLQSRPPNESPKVYCADPAQEREYADFQFCEFKLRDANRQIAAAVRKA